MDSSQRKPNRLQEFDYSTNGVYFVTICTQDRRRILSRIVGDDAHIVPKLYGSIAEKYIRNVPEIKKYVIMPDHIHMLICLDNGSMWASTPTKETEHFSAEVNTCARRQHNRVSSIVRSIKVLTAKEIGQSIFQRSFYDHVIRNQRDYDEIWQYIENNPRKWLIQNRGIE